MEDRRRCFRHLEDQPEEKVEERRLAMEIEDTAQQVAFEQRRVQVLPEIGERLHVEAHAEGKEDASGDEKNSRQAQQVSLVTDAHPPIRARSPGP